MIASSLQTITFLTTLLNISCGSTVLNITPFGKLLKHKQEDIKGRNLTKGCKTQNQKRSNALQMSVIENGGMLNIIALNFVLVSFQAKFLFHLPNQGIYRTYRHIFSKETTRRTMHHLRLYLSR